MLEELRRRNFADTTVRTYTNHSGPRLGEGRNRRVDEIRRDYDRHAPSFDQQGWQGLGGVVEQKATDCVFRLLLRTTSAGLALVFAIRPVVNWRKFSSILGTSVCRRRSGTWDANSVSKTQ
jgi:hypothetical protein